MRVCVFGAGAIGGVVAAGLMAAGNKVSVVARGGHLAAIREKGLRIETGDDAETWRLAATDRPQELGPQDFVITTVKAHALPSAADAILPLLGAATGVVYALNGIPWWYFHREGGRFDGRRIDLLDPGGSLWERVGVERAIGCVVNFASSNPAPGLVRRAGIRNRLLLGEPSGETGARLGIVASALSGAGFVVETAMPIRHAIWGKLRRGAVSSAFATLTAGPAGQSFASDDLRELFRRAMDDLTRIAAAYGVALADDVEAQLDDVAASRHSPSMLQDLGKRRSMEIDAQLSAPLHLARLAGVDVPTFEAIVGLARARAANAGLYRL